MASSRKEEESFKLNVCTIFKVASLIESNDDPIIPLWLSTFTGPLFQKVFSLPGF